jgi:hypothetical protein
VNDLVALLAEVHDDPAAGDAAFHPTDGRSK